MSKEVVKKYRDRNIFDKHNEEIIEKIVNGKKKLSENIKEVLSIKGTTAMGMGA